MSKKKRYQMPTEALKSTPNVENKDYYELESLDDLLVKLKRSLEVAKASKGKLPEKIWMKQQFAIGVNDVTRVLERMPKTNPGYHSNGQQTSTALRRGPLVPLQAVLLATDCNPKWLTKHVPTLASTRKVPVIFLKDNKESALKLGELVNVRTALAIGIKASGSIINKTIDEVLMNCNSISDLVN